MQRLRFLQFFQILTLVVVSVTGDVDYCEESLCKAGKHVGCGNSGGFDKDCPPDTKIVKLSKNEIEFILNEHNFLRNKIASGQESGFNTAAKMATLVWNRELARLAEFNARSCKFAHDQCRNTKTFSYAGQNIAQTQTQGSELSTIEFLKRSISDWYGEIRDAKQADMDKYEQSGRTIGHFTQMVNDLSNEVGCAVVDFDRDGWRTMIFVCDYARTNIIGYPIYESGPPTSKCTSGANALYSALCRADEAVDPNFL